VRAGGGPGADFHAADLDLNVTRIERSGKVVAEVARRPQRALGAGVIPFVAYIDPEVAWVEVTETEARANGIPLRKRHCPWARCASGARRGSPSCCSIRRRTAYLGPALSAATPVNSSPRCGSPSRAAAMRRTSAHDRRSAGRHDLELGSQQQRDGTQIVRVEHRLAESSRSGRSIGAVQPGAPTGEIRRCSYDPAREPPLPAHE
jgi:hypothetical protein